MAALRSRSGRALRSCSLEKSTRSVDGWTFRANGLRSQAATSAYTVQPGDTLFDLSRRTGVPVAEIARANGIPVLASDRPGHGEAVGPGGILVDPDAPIDTWVDALARLKDLLKPGGAN